MKNVIFINNNEALPEYVDTYLGWYVLKNSDLYLGTPSGWRELTNTIVGNLDDLATEVKTSIVDAINELKSKITAGGASIDDEAIAEDTTWSSKKISEKLDNSDNIKYYETKDEWRLDTTREIPCICYIKDIDKIVFDNGAEIATPYDWNFSDSKFNKLGTINSVTTVDDLTLNSGIQVNAYRTTIDNIDYTYRVYMSNTGSKTSLSLSFELTGNDDIEILFQAGGSNRTLRLEKEDGTVIRTFTGTTAQWHTFHYGGDACRVYLYMVSGTGYIYDIKLNV